MTRVIVSPVIRERYRQRAIESYRRHALEGFQNSVAIEFPVCGDDAPAVGALGWAAAERIVALD